MMKEDIQTWTYMNLVFDPKDQKEILKLSYLLDKQIKSYI